MILKFDRFISESKNDPIPELTNDNLCIMLMGTPGVGKSYFIKNFIQHRKDIKTFSTDDVSLLYTKDPNKYHSGSSDINTKRIITFTKTKQSFVYDTTGTQTEQVFKIVKSARDNNYSVIFIHLVGTLNLSLKQNLDRNRNVDKDYIQFSYQNQFRNMETYRNINPDAYYVVYNKNGKWKFYKFDNEKLLKRKMDKYVPHNEGFKKYLIGGALLATLMSNPIYAKDSNKLSKQKAELSIIDSSTLENVYSDLLSKEYDIVSGNIIDMSGDEFIFTSASNQSNNYSIQKSKEDLDSKLLILKKKEGNQIIFTKYYNGTYNTVMITEIK